MLEIISSRGARDYAGYISWKYFSPTDSIGLIPSWAAAVDSMESRIIAENPDNESPVETFPYISLFKLRCFFMRV